MQEKTQIGLVISYFGNSVAVEDAHGQVFQCHLKRNQTLPVVGDHVQFYLETGDSGVIQAIQPRTSILGRGDGRGQMKVIAANVNKMVIVMAPPPILSEYLIDRYLVAASALSIEAMIILNKIDLLDDLTLNAVKSRLKPYEKLYPIIYTSVITEAGFAALNTALSHQTAVLVGPSGVGKSSMIAALCNDESIRIGDVSAKGSGKHTTTATRLYHLPNSGDLIDSPGVREFALWPVTPKEILSGFQEFLPYQGQCKFRDCAHLREPDCAVKTAVSQGKISDKRYEIFVALMQEATQHKKF